MKAVSEKMELEKYKRVKEDENRKRRWQRTRN
jgi:hypothetical protein